MSVIFQSNISHISVTYQSYISPRVQMMCCAKVFWKPLTSAATVARCLRPTVELDGMVLDLLPNRIYTGLIDISCPS